MKPQAQSAMKTQKWQSPKRKRSSVTKASKKLNSTPAREPSLSHTGSLSSMDNSQEYADPKYMKWPMDAPQSLPSQHRHRVETPQTQVSKFGGLQSPLASTTFGSRLLFTDTPTAPCETPVRRARSTAEPYTSVDESKDDSDTRDLAKRFPPSPPSHLSFASFPDSLPRVHSPESPSARSGCATPLSSISANDSPSSFYIHTESPHFIQSPPSPVLGARTPSTHSHNSDLETPIEEGEQEVFRIRGAARLSFTPVAQLDENSSFQEDGDESEEKEALHSRMRGSSAVVEDDDDEDEEVARATDQDGRMLSGSMIESPINTPWRSRERDDEDDDSLRDRRGPSDLSSANLSGESLNTSDGGANRSAFRPLPDQSAFDMSRRPKSNTTVNRSLTASTPVCPPTPQRTPAWLHESVSAPVLARHNSLVVNKVLVSSGSDNGSVTFSEQFENLGTLGAGVFSDVYKVRSKIDHKLYAVKKSKRQFRSKRDRERLIQEVVVMRRLGSCQYIPQCYRAWQEDGYFYAQMELCEKGTLKQMVLDMMVQHRDIPDQTIWKITHDVAAALLHVHQNGMVHMDVKPSNILISSSGILKLADFGLATDQGSSRDGNEGDNRYMAPELLQSNARTPALDMFSFGMTLYEICRGIVENLPIEGQGWHDLRDGRLSPYPVQRPIDLVYTINALLSRNPSNRPSAADLLAMPEVGRAKDRQDPIIAAVPERGLNRVILSRAPSLQHPSISVSNLQPIAERVMTPTEIYVQDLWCPGQYSGARTPSIPEGCEESGEQSMAENSSEFTFVPVDPAPATPRATLFTPLQTQPQQRHLPRRLQQQQQHRLDAEVVMDARNSNEAYPDTSSEEANDEDEVGKTPIKRPSPKRATARTRRQTRMETRLHKQSYEPRVLRRRGRTSPTTTCVAMSYNDHQN